MCDTFSTITTAPCRNPLASRLLCLLGVNSESAALSLFFFIIVIVYLEPYVVKVLFLPMFFSEATFLTNLVACSSLCTLSRLDFLFRGRFTPRAVLKKGLEREKHILNADGDDDAHVGTDLKEDYSYNGPAKSELELRVVY